MGISSNEIAGVMGHGVEGKLVVRDAVESWQNQFRSGKSIITFEGYSSEMSGATEEVVACENCGNPIDSCMCACPYCGQVDACECCLYDAATGGG